MQTKPCNWRLLRIVCETQRGFSFWLLTSRFAVAANKRSPHGCSRCFVLCMRMYKERYTERERVVSAEVPTKAINVSLYLLVRHTHLLKLRPTESESDRVWHFTANWWHLVSSAAWRCMRRARRRTFSSLSGAGHDASSCMFYSRSISICCVALSGIRWENLKTPVDWKHLGKNGWVS